ncbi:MAG TPA: hypothetical protein VNF75_09190 [Candidatus Dormibacteraeota bacterium]|nr:hypothetical protein [Candidatus Dormibacteraeota bacterium]
MRKAAGTLGLALGAALLIGGCGRETAGTAPTPNVSAPARTAAPATPSTLSLAAAGAAYLADVAPDNAAVNAFNALPPNTPVATGAQPLIAADSAFETKLETTNWPLVAQADVKALTTAIGQVDSYLETAGTTGLLGQAAWNQGFASAENVSTIAANEVRHDLGLPPVS